LAFEASLATDRRAFLKAKTFALHQLAIAGYPRQFLNTIAEPSFSEAHSARRRHERLAATLWSGRTRVFRIVVPYHPLYAALVNRVIARHAASDAGLFIASILKSNFELATSWKLGLPLRLAIRCASRVEDRG